MDDLHRVWHPAVHSEWNPVHHEREDSAPVGHEGTHRAGADDQPGVAAQTRDGHAQGGWNRLNHQGSASGGKVSQTSPELLYD